MKTSRFHLTQILFVLSLFLLFPGFIQAETTNCTAIPSVPYTITVPGIYCLTGNLETAMTEGNAITIKNGTIRGFRNGVYLRNVSPYTTSQGHMIEDIRADMNTHLGIIVYGLGNIIRNNQVVDTGGSTIIAWASGIYTVGPGARVINNDVYETKEAAGETSYGISD
jgi:hypothetical protein